MRYGLDASNQGAFDDRVCFPAQSSVLDEEALLRRVIPDYDIPVPRDCLFFSRGDSDIYQVQTVGPTFYLKVCRPPFLRARAEAEAHLLADLSANGASVVTAIRRRDGAFASEVVASEGRRPMLLFEEAPARFGPVGVDACRQLGAAVARLHAAGDCIAGTHVSPCELDDLTPFAARLAYTEDVAELERLRTELEDHARSLSAGQEDQDAGWCHNDLVLSNVRRRRDGTIVLLDFGNSAVASRVWEFSRVWRALQTHEDPERPGEFWEAFLEGYVRVRQLPEGADRPDQLIVFEALRRIRWIGGVMASCPLRMGTENFDREWVRTQLHGVRELAAPLLSPGE